MGRTSGTESRGIAANPYRVKARKPCGKTRSPAQLALDQAILAERDARRVARIAERAPLDQAIGEILAAAVRQKRRRRIEHELQRPDLSEKDATSLAHLRGRDDTARDEDSFLAAVVELARKYGTNVVLDQRGKHTVRAIDLLGRRLQDSLARVLRDRPVDASLAEDQALISKVLMRHHLDTTGVGASLDRLGRDNGDRDWVRAHGGARTAAIALLDQLGLRGSYVYRLNATLRDVEGGDEAELLRRAQGVHVRPRDSLLYAVEAFGLRPASASRLLAARPR